MTVSSVDTLGRMTSTALAAYGNLAFGPDDDLKAALIAATNNVNFTSVQADNFAAQSQVLDQLPNVPCNGFSATVFLDKLTGKHVISMRGTETNTVGQALLDLLVTDGLSIAGNGFANNQAVEMIRYYKRLTTPAGMGMSMGMGILLGISQILRVKANATSTLNKPLLPPLCAAPDLNQLFAIGSAANEEVLICAA